MFMKTLKFEYTNHTGETKTREVSPGKIKLGLTPHISKPEWLLEAMDLQTDTEHCFVLKNIQRIIDDSIQRFFCVTVYVMNHEKKFLMLLNKKLNKWVPPGGKVDRHETPDEAALRECLEETGIHIKLHGTTTPVDGELINPYGMQLNTIVPNVRDHIDLIYLGLPTQQEEKLKISEREASDIGWFDLNEILQLNTFPSIIKWCKFFKERF